MNLRGKIMGKKLLHLILLLSGITAICIGVYYFFTKKKVEKELWEDENDDDFDSMDLKDMLDFSNLKFSRHYVDLR